jgi:hypothetical protein
MYSDASSNGICVRTTGHRIHTASYDFMPYLQDMILELTLKNVRLTHLILEAFS